MSVFLFDILAILVFLKSADFSRVKEFLPVVLSGIFFRFLEHYFVIDWFEIWEIPGPEWMQLWLPISADLTAWPVVCYLFLQYLPRRSRILYGLMWVFVMLVYLLALERLNVFKMHKGWNFGLSAITVSAYFCVVYLIWRWQEAQRTLSPIETG